MGKARVRTIGSRREVFNGTAKRTSGGLEKKDLLKNKHNRIVSRRKHNTAKKEKRLLKHGFGYKKGSFGYVSTTPKAGRRGRRTRRRRGSRRRRC